jgi:hypothetical protein
MVLALGFSTATGVNAGEAAAKGGSKMNSALIEMTQQALQMDEVLKNVVYQAYVHDGKVGEAVKGNYEIKPEKIIHWNDHAISVVKISTTRGGKAKMFTFAFVFSAEELQTLLLYPGNSNADPALFGDVFAPAKGFVQGRLKSEEVNVKDTAVIGDIRPTGWDEEWLWVNDRGETYTMTINFSTAPEGGTIWNIKGYEK